MSLARIILIIALLLQSHVTFGHAFSPTVLDVKVNQGGTVDLWWKDSNSGAQRNTDVLRIVPSEACVEFGGSSRDYAVADVRIRHRDFKCNDSAQVAPTLTIEGLAQSQQTILARVLWPDQSERAYLLKGDIDTIDLSQQRESARRSEGLKGSYTILGIEHVLLGLDHLVFVLCLFLIGPNDVGRIVAVMTAFTVAHSITLALAVLDFVSLPQGPVECMIALSIMWAATHVVTGKRHKIGQLWPLMVLFGLVHGLGFASSIQQVGFSNELLVPQLLAFNAGIEIGQLAVLLGAWAVHRLAMYRAPTIPLAAGVGYVSGCFGAFLLIDRLVGLFPASGIF